MLIYENLLQARKNKKLSQRELGEMVGVSGTIIGLYENGVRTPRPDTLQRLAQALEVKEEWLDPGEDANQQREYRLQLDSIMELVSLLERPEKEQKFLSSYARLNLALTELNRAVEDRQVLDGDAELEALRKIEMFAISCCSYFADLQQANPGGYAEMKERFSVWQQEKRKFDDMLSEYLKLNLKGRRIAVNTLTALATAPEYQRSKLELEAEGFDLKLVGRYFRRVREEAGLSLQEVGERCSLSEGDIRQIEQGKRIPTAADLCRISYALGIRLTELLPFEAGEVVMVNKMYDVLQDCQSKEDVPADTKQMIIDAHMKILEDKIQKVLFDVNARNAQKAAEQYNKE